MLTELQNDCTNPLTLTLCNKFITSPHCLGWLMYPAAEDEHEIIEITIKHYTEIITVVFNVETEVGEVLLHTAEGESGGEDDLASAEYCGVITVDKLVELLEKLPHIKHFMEEGVGEGVLH